MRKCLVLTMLFCVVGICCMVAAEEESQPAHQRPASPFMNEDGKIDLKKVEASNLPNARKNAFKKADKDGDGFLDSEEMKTVMGRRGARPEGERGNDRARDEGRNESRAPMARGNKEAQRGGMPPFMQNLMTEEGKLDLAKLEKTRMPEEQKTRFKNADKDKDGFLDQDEMRSIMRNQPRPEGFGEGRFVFMHSVMTEDGKVDLSKLTKADKNGDDFLDQDELKTLMPKDGQMPGRSPRGTARRPDQMDRPQQGERPYPRRTSKQDSNNDK
ncbi:MAG: hypothetical protein PHQ75_11530 [Thermoguttaceae bacterium]|nr:hypothetical protein [Thermoguttaceae bacterium]